MSNPIAVAGGKNSCQVAKSKLRAIMMTPIKVPIHPAKTAPEEKLFTRVLISLLPEIENRKAGTNRGRAGKFKMPTILPTIYVPH